MEVIYHWLFRTRCGITTSPEISEDGPLIISFYKMQEYQKNCAFESRRRPAG